MKRILWTLPVLLLLILVLPAAAQSGTQEAAQKTPLDWIPADFTGFVTVNFTDAQTTLSSLNLSYYTASVLQPPRLQYTQATDFDPFIPLTTFDVEKASFTQNILPWLNHEVIIAYKNLGERFDASPDNTVMIFPAMDSLQAASSLQAVIKGQDFLKRESYHDIPIYVGDKTSFAFLPLALITGPSALLNEIIDTMNGDSVSLTADPLYQQVEAALPQTSVLSAYVGKDAAAHALGVLMSGSGAADPIMTAIHDSLAALKADNTPERLLLSGALDGIGVSVNTDLPKGTSLTANVVLHTVDAPEATDTPFDPAVLDLIPRSAMIVQSGTDASSTATDALYSLPFLNFAGKALAAFPVAQTSGQALPLPTGRDAQSAVSGFLSAMKTTVDVQGDLIDKLKGSYSLALLPRPNDPMPVLNTPYDLLLVVKTDSPEAAQAAQSSASKLLAAFTSPLEDVELDTLPFQTLRMADTGEALVSVGAVDNMLVIGTGSAAQLALDARNGDNRLTAQDRWTKLSQNDQLPYVYVDVNAFYNTFLPTIGGPAVRLISQFGIHSRYLGDNLFALEMLVALSE